MRTAQSGYLIGHPQVGGPLLLKLIQMRSTEIPFLIEIVAGHRDRTFTLAVADFRHPCFLQWLPRKT